MAFEARSSPEETVPSPGPALLGAAAFAMAWAIARAFLQSVTVDEADSYLMFAGRGWPAVLHPGSGNHVLNTVIAWAATTAFGLSHLTLRVPTLIGAGIYISAALALCTSLSGRPEVRWPLFACLVYNPFVMDYLVAARGYGLALGFMMAAIWATAESRYTVASFCAGLSFCSSFSFAYVDAALILVCCARAWQQTGSWRTPAVCALSGGGTALVLCGWTLARWPKGELLYGATDLRQMWDSIASATFDELNPMLASRWPAPAVWALGPALASLLLGVMVWQVGRILRSGHALGVGLAVAGLTALVAHLLQLRLAGIPLPLGRTGVFFVPLALLLIGIGSALPAASRLDAWSRGSGVAVLSLSAVYFLGCLRLSHFKEWKFDAEVKEAFVALERRHREHPLRAVAADWRYSDALNFYRECLHHPEIGPFAEGEPTVPDRSAYVLYFPLAEDFIRKQALQVIYRGPLSDVVVAVPPSIAGP